MDENGHDTLVAIGSFAIHDVQKKRVVEVGEPSHEHETRVERGSMLPFLLVSMSVSGQEIEMARAGQKSGEKLLLQDNQIAVHEHEFIRTFN